MLYVIKNIDRGSKYYGYYVALSGNKSSYTRNINYIRFFKSKDEALNNICIESEAVVLFKI